MMMERLREGVNSIAIKIILGLIILSFIFAGVGSYIVGGNANVAAKVNGVEIARGELEQAYQNERSRMQSQLGDYFSSLLADPNYAASFRRSVLDTLINNLLLEQYAESLGLRVGDEQIRQAILAMPEFQNQGRFDQNIYQSTLRRANFSPDSFAQYLRQELVREQLLSVLQQSDFVLDNETEQVNALLSQKRVIRTLTLPIADFAQQATLTDEDIQAYYESHPQRYTRPDQVKLSYIELSAQQLKANITITDEQAQAYYQEQQKKYRSEEQRKISHILIQDDLAAIEAIEQELKAGADFSQLAREKSQDFGSADEGGALGWIEPNTMDDAFEKAAFALKSVGEVSGIVKSAFGYHLIRLDEVQPSVIKPYEAVAQEIKQELQDQTAIEQFYTLQAELERVAFESPDSLEEASLAIALPTQHTDYISEQQLPSVLNNAAVKQVLQTPEVREDGLNSELIEVAPEHVVVVHVDAARAETVLPLAEVRNQVVADLSARKGEEQAQALANTLIEALKQGDDTVLAEYKLTLSEQETIDRDSPLASVVYALPKPQDNHWTYAQTKTMTGDLIIIELHDVVEESNEQFSNMIASQLMQMSAQQELSSVLNILRAKADIDYYAINE